MPDLPGLILLVQAGVDTTQGGAGVPAGPGWSVSDWTGTISAISAAVAALASAWAVWATRRMNRRDVAWRHAEKRHVYYDAIVKSPALDAVRTYGPLIRQTLAEGEERIEQMVENNAGMRDTETAVNELLDEHFAEHQTAMMRAITEAAEAWDDPDLPETLRRAAESLQARVAEEVTKLITPNASPDIVGVLNRELGELSRIAMRHDPAMIELRNGTQTRKTRRR